MSREQIISSLESAIVELTDAYTQMREILSVQIKAVVRNNIDGINDGTEQQIEQNALIQSLETRFRLELLDAFEAVAPDNASKKLSELILFFPEAKDKLIELREGLIFTITRTQHKQEQLVNLLEFARQHTTETLRAIHAMGNEKNTSYNIAGKTAQHQNQSIAINQTA